MRVNLHTHSNISDGKLTPEELVDKLYHDGVNIMALTDHDNLKGLIKAKSRADELGVKFINGIEISTKIIGLGIDFLDPNLHTLHLLGLNFDYFKLLNFYENIDKNKEQKLKVLNEELIKNGYKIPYYNNLTKRLTLAEALVENGYEKNTEDAFNNIINKYYDRWSDNIDVKKAVEIIHQSNGKILWAHPFEILIGTSKYSLNEQQIDIIAGKLKEFGVDGIEVYYQKYNSEQIKFLEQIQKKYNFIASAGTDYHAKDNQPNTYYEIDETFIKGVLK